MAEAAVAISPPSQERAGDLSAAGRELHSCIRGRVIVDSSQLRRYARDYGRMMDRQPGLVICPESSAEVALVVRWCRSHGLRICLRGAGHSQGGQSLSQGGAVLDVSRIDAGIKVTASVVEVSAGCAWQDVVAETIRHNRVPPVLTSNLDTTVGGTASVGGIGASSFRYGAQIDLVEEIEVVTAQGDVVWCSPRDEKYLFDNVLGGLGQFGAITRVRCQLREPKPYVCSTLLVYPHADALVGDALQLVSSNEVDYLRSFAKPFHGRWFYFLELTTEAESPDTKHDKLLRRLVYSQIAISNRVQPFREWVWTNRTSGGPGEQEDRAAPGVDVFLPPGVAGPFIADALETIPPDLWACSGVDLLYFANHLFTRSLFIKTSSALSVLFGLKFVVPPTQRSRVAKLCEAVDQRALAMGGTRYLCGWIPFDQKRWAAHYGRRWSAVREAKRAIDPEGVFDGPLLRDL